MNVPDVALSLYKFLLGAPVGTFLCDAKEHYVDKNHQAKISGFCSKKIYEAKHKHVLE